MLNETQKGLLRPLADNPALFEAVKKVITDKFSLDMLHSNMLNETLGQLVRARLEGLKSVEDGFNEIALCRTTALRPDEEKNQAR